MRVATKVSWLFGLGRGLALFLGTFSASNLLAAWIAPGGDATIWWLDVRSVPEPARHLLLYLGTLALLWCGVRPGSTTKAAPCWAALLAVLGGIAWMNALSAFAAQGAGHVDLGGGIPFSLLLGVALLLLAGAVLRSSWRRHLALVQPRSVLIWFLVAVVLFPLCQMFFFGRSEYFARADAIVVFGARVYANGLPSDPLRDRVTTAAEVFREGRARWVIMSGGPGDGTVPEADAMRRLACDLGVPAPCVRVDYNGVSTEATIRNAKALATDIHATALLAVSHNYHLPRIKLGFQRVGVNVLTVPARERYTLVKLPYFLMREVAAFWYYYIDGILSWRQTGFVASSSDTTGATTTDS